MTTTTDTRVNDLIINKMSKVQFDALPEKSPTELYVVEGDSNVIYAEQAIELPTASESNLGRLFQYIGITDATYTNGYFYKCVSDGQSPATYSWENIEVQPAPDPLPSQTGNAGKVLTTDGTNASWESTSMSPATPPTLVAANWSSNTQTITVQGVTATNTIIVSPIPTDAEDYAAAGILCTGQATNALTFTCQTTPVSDLQVNIVIM